MKTLISFDEYPDVGGMILNNMVEVDADPQADPLQTLKAINNSSKYECVKIVATEQGVPRLGGDAELGFWRIARNYLNEQPHNFGVFYAGQKEIEAHAIQYSDLIGKAVSCIPLPRGRLNYTVNC